MSFFAQYCTFTCIWLLTVSDAPYEDVDISDQRREMQRMLNAQNEDEVVAYYKEKYASGHTARYGYVQYVHAFTCSVYIHVLYT